MTVEQFNDEVTSMAELIDFCNDNGVCEDVIENIIDDYTMADYIWDSIRDYWGSWQDLRYDLGNIPEGYDFYRYDGSLEYTGLDESDFRDLKQEVFDNLVDMDWFEIDGEDECESHGTNDDADSWVPFDTSIPPALDMEDFDCATLYAFCGAAQGFAGESVANRAAQTHCYPEGANSPSDDTAGSRFEDLFVDVPDPVQVLGTGDNHEELWF